MGSSGMLTCTSALLFSCHSYLCFFLIGYPRFDETITHEWPNRRAAILARTTILVVISKLFVIWRVIYGIENKRKGMICDALLCIVVVALYNKLYNI
jgi:hypothetical protein